MKSRSKISLNALKTFEAVARHNSMSMAAQELSVTPGAVSRQIAELQSVLSFDLFIGSRNQRALTTDGRLLAQTLTIALDEIDATLLTLDDARGTTLDVACLSTMAVRWLIPRLHRFRAKHPTIDIRLSTDPRKPDRHHNRLDVSILVLHPDDAPMQSDTILFAEELGPVLKPKQAGNVARPADLQAFPLLTTKTRPDAWHEWQSSLGLPLHKPTERIAFEHLSLAIEAAATGLGVCVAPKHLVQTDLSNGRLASPMGFQPSGYTYIVRAHGRPKRRAQAFAKWICEEVQEAEV
jgi:LysR family transcriptional regulator, glycine cleavage system transcriptional activator